MLDKQLQAESDLAIAYGWTNLVDVGGTLLGTPPGGAQNSRGQAAVPHWTRDWSACGPLISAHDLSIDGIRFTPADQHVVVSFGSLDHQFVLIPTTEWGSADEALRYAITIAALVHIGDRRSKPRHCSWCAAADTDNDCYCRSSAASIGETP